MTRIDVPVLIVGGGPVGLMTALLLHRCGIASRIVERRAAPQRAPAAHVVNARTFEICRQAGVDMQAIAAAATPPADGGATYWVTKLGGEVLGRLPFERQEEAVLALTPTPLRNLSQHRFEPILLETLRDCGAPTPRFGHRWMSAEADADGVTSHLVDGEAQEYTVRSRYLIGADGAGSPVRKWLGIEPIGPDRLQTFMMIHFAADLRALVRDCPGVLYWVCDPDCLSTFVAHDIDREWVLMQPWDPQREARETFDVARCEALVRKGLAQPDVQLAIRTVSPWVMTCQVASQYRDGRTFLAGDAAHRFPPTGGLGLNTGVQDAHNLAWKLAAVLGGTAPPTLLDTYECERRPVAQYNAEQSLQNAMRLMEVPQAFGFSDDPDEARRNFDAALADPARRRVVEAAIGNQAEHFDMLGLQLGYRYETGALLDDGERPDAPPDPVREFRPTSTPGARLPHGWLVRDGAACSSLDLIGLDRLTLLIGPHGDAWRTAIASLQTPVTTVQIGRDALDPHAWWTTSAAMSADGALLVRPDQHIAFRARQAPSDRATALRHALAAALGDGTVA